MLLLQSRKFERRVDSSVLKAYVEIYPAMSSKKKRKSSCPFASAKNAPKRKKMKTFDKDLAQALAASDKGSVPLRCLRPRSLFSPRLVFGISKYIC